MANGFNIGQIAFLAGIIVSAVGGIFTGLGQLSGLIVLGSGIIVALMNVSASESQKAIWAFIGLALIGAAGFTAAFTTPFFGFLSTAASGVFGYFTVVASVYLAKTVFDVLKN